MSAGTLNAARKRFGTMEGEAGVCYTRTGRRFFNDASLEPEFLEQIREAVTMGDSGYLDSQLE